MRIDPETTPPKSQDAHRSATWRGATRRTVGLLLVWFVAGPVLGILLAEHLNRVLVAGVPLGFWVAQQGAIYVFVILIFVYAWLSERAEKRAGLVERPDADETRPDH